MQLEQQLKEVTQLLHTAQKDIQVLSQKVHALNSYFIKWYLNHNRQEIYKKI